MNKQRANALGDYAHFFTHFGLISAVTAGVFLTLGFPPVLGTLAIGATAGIHLKLLPWIKDELQQAINEESSLTKGFSRNGKTLNPWRDTKPGRNSLNARDGDFRTRVEGWTKEYAEKLGLKRTPQLLVMEDNENIGDYLGRAHPNGTKLQKILKTFNKHANAFAFSHLKNNVVVSAPLVKSLNESELKGVVAHEVGHLAASHGSFREIMSAVSLPAKILTGLNLIVTAFSSAKNAGIYILAGTIAEFASKKYASIRELDAEIPREKAKIDVFKRYFANATLAGMSLTLGAPEILAAQALNLAAKETFELIEKRHSRRNEFQADRIAVQVTKDPISMCNALRKVQEEHLKAEPGFNYDSPKQPESERTILTTLFDRAKDMKKTHPNIERRCRAIMDVPIDYPATALA